MKLVTQGPRDAGQLLRAVARRVAPVWPLDRLVAVNPYHGLQDRSFEEAAALLERVGGARSTASEGAYLAALRDGELDASDLDAVLTEAGSRLSREQVLDALRAEELSPRGPEVATVAGILGEVPGSPWARFLPEHLGGFLASYFDPGYAAWRPETSQGLYATWRAEASIDRTPEVLGAAGPEPGSDRVEIGESELERVGHEPASDPASSTTRTSGTADRIRRVVSAP